MVTAHTHTHTQSDTQYVNMVTAHTHTHNDTHTHNKSSSSKQLQAFQVNSDFESDFCLTGIGTHINCDSPRPHRI